MIEHLKTNKLKLIAELTKSNDRAMKTMKLKQLIEKEATRLKLKTQGIEMENRRLKQQIQTLTEMIEYVRSTIVKSMNEFASRLKLDLNAFIREQQMDDNPVGN